MPAKTFFGKEVGLSDPSDEPVAVALDDDDALPNGRCNYLFVGVGGNVALKTRESGDPILYKNVPSGSYLWVRALYVMATDTTATDIIAHY
jgi:hypothetical protein